MANNDLIYKDNKIVEASYRLTLTEQRIILFAISQVNALEKLTEDKVFTISASEYSSVFGIAKDQAFHEMKDAMDELSKRWVKVRANNDKKTEIRWISEKSTISYNQSIEIRFTTSIAPYLNNLKGNFTKYQLMNVSSMKSIYSIRIYEILMQWKTSRTVTLTIDQLRERLEATTKGYRAFSNIKMKIIDPAILEINYCSDIEASYELQKKGNKVLAVKFQYQFKPGMEPKKAEIKQAVVKQLRSALS